MPRALVPCLAVLVLLPSIALAEDWERSFPVTGRADVRVRTNDGHVRVTRGTGKQVVVHVHTDGWRIGRQVQVDARRVGGRIEVETRTPSWNWGLTFSMHGRRVLVDVMAPRETDLEVHTGDGGIEVEGLAGALELDTGDGAVRARDLAGDLRIHSGDGSIEASGLDGRLSATSGDGPVRVSGRFDALDLETGDGRVVAEALTGSTVGSGWSLESGDGSLTLRLGGRIAADLDARTNDGSIHLELPIAVSGDWGSHLHGSLNGGGPPIRLRTGDGPIRIEKL